MSRYDIYLSITRREFIRRAIERWARWCVSVHDYGGSYVQLGYGKGGHARILSGPPTGKRSTSPTVAVTEEKIEQALWRYQKLDGYNKQAMHVAAFRLKHLENLTNADAAETMRVSVSTYKRYVANVMAYLMQEVFDELK